MPKFNPDKDIPNLSGKVILVTGGNNGLGKETVLQLSKHEPAHIFLAARSEAKALPAIEEMCKAVPDAAPITFIPLDLASFDSIKQAAASFKAQSSQLHVLINNAGIMGTPAGTTKEGYEVQFGTNYVGHALLTKLLLPMLDKNAIVLSQVFPAHSSSFRLEGTDSPRNSESIHPHYGVSPRPSPGNPCEQHQGED
ncbi:hypothetical protein BKA56DRAFT_614035 [Ilyonectria sp. MPI-CAGE-AT-0026]|nr:hypothetical protein BKA56DRAFT_614035 [Ilyonectria sp. MPI-CAGE-AT-0026]